MPAKTTAKNKRWFVDLCEQGCQICGMKFHGQKNNGLKWSHIVSKKDGGSDESTNCLVLCPNCEYAFDVIIKPAIYAALEKSDSRIVPESWKHGESRKSKLLDKNIPLDNSSNT